MKKTFFLLFLPGFLFAQGKTSALDSYLQAQNKLYGFNGNVLVAKNGTVIYEKSFGYSDYQSKEKLNSNSVFDCGSIAKQFTAMAILLLKDKGKISYSDTITKFLPELPYNNITIQQLLTHTSGVPDGFGLIAKFFDHNKIAYNNDLIRLLASEKPPLLFKPGSSLMYSGTGFNLLASVIEKVSGRSFNDYMAEQVFKPLGMTNTQVVNGPRSPDKIPGYVYGFSYSDSLKTYVRAETIPSGWISYFLGINGEGMILTITEDLLKWDRALKNHSLLNETTQREMVSAQAEKTTVPFVSYGYGVRVGKNAFGNYVFHNGYYPGYVSMLIRYTDEDLTAIVLSNNESRADFIADGLMAIVLKKNFVMPYAHKQSKTTFAFDKFSGKFMMPLARPPFLADFPTELIIKENRLFLHPPRGADIELIPESATKFYYADGTDQQLEFEDTNNGEQLKAWYIGWGVKREIKGMD